MFCIFRDGWKLCQKISFFTLGPISSVLSIIGRKKRFSENVNFPLLQDPSKCSIVCPLNSMLYYKFQNIAILTYCTFCVCIIITFSFFPILLPLHIYIHIYMYIHIRICQKKWQKNQGKKSQNSIWRSFIPTASTELSFLLLWALWPACQLLDLPCPHPCPPKLISLHFVTGCCCLESLELIMSQGSVCSLRDFLSQC